MPASVTCPWTVTGVQREQDPSPELRGLHRARLGDLSSGSRHSRFLTSPLRPFRPGHAYLGTRAEPSVQRPGAQHPPSTGSIHGVPQGPGSPALLTAPALPWGRGSSGAEPSAASQGAEIQAHETPARPLGCNSPPPKRFTETAALFRAREINLEGLQRLSVSPVTDRAIWVQSPEDENLQHRRSEKH